MGNVQQSISELKEVPKHSSKPGKFDKPSGGRKYPPPPSMLIGEVNGLRQANVKYLSCGGDNYKTFHFLIYFKPNYHARLTCRDGNGKERDFKGGN